MPSMGKFEFNHESKSGERYEFRGEVSVDSRGIFAIVLDSELAEVAGGMGFSVTKPRTNWRLEHRDLETARRQVRTAVTEMMAAEVLTERVIVYSTDLKASFWQNPDGTIAANGYTGVPREEGGDWGTVGGLSATTTVPHFTVGLFARVFDRVEYRRPSGSKVVYEKADMGNLYPDDPAFEWAHRLNSFSGLYMSFDRLDRLPRVAYTEEAAKFFYETLCGICVLARNIDGFFKSPERLQLAIDKQTPLLAAPQADAHA